MASPETPAGKNARALRTGAEKVTILGFATIIALLLGLGVYAVVTQDRLAQDVVRLNRHPLAVTNAAREVIIGITSMQIQLTGAAWANLPEEREEAFREMERLEEWTRDRFTILDVRYLGDPAQVKALRTGFLQWSELRRKVARSWRLNQDDEALRTALSEGRALVGQLTDRAEELVTFASHKAEEFQNRADSSRRTSRTIIGLVLLVLLGLSLGVARFSLGSLRKYHDEVSRNLALVDQNIMSASLSAAGEIQTVTNALCRHLKVNKQDVEGRPEGLAALGIAECGEVEGLVRAVTTGASSEAEVALDIGPGEAREWLLVRAVPERHRDGNVASYSLFFTDITDRKKVEELSITDALTRLHNRRHFDTVLGRELRVARRAGIPLTLALLDVDCFKGYNDTFGHPAGDRVLKAVSKVLRQELKRPTDHVFRIGGEEFAILFSCTDAMASEAFLEHLRLQVRELKIGHPANTAAGVVTVSLGAAIWRGSSRMDAESLIKLADEALYESKQRRDAVVVRLCSGAPWAPDTALADEPRRLRQPQ